MLTRKHAYTGPAWYARRLRYRHRGAIKSIQLTLERTVEYPCVGGWQECGADESLIAPHPLLRHHRIHARQTPPGDPGWTTGNGPDMSTRTTWRMPTPTAHRSFGTASSGKLQLEARNKIHIAQTQVYPDLAGRSARVRVQVKNESGAAAKARYPLQPGEKTQTLNAELPGGASSHELTLQFGADMKTWDEFHPHVYTLQTTLAAGNGQRRPPHYLRDAGGNEQERTAAGERQTHFSPRHAGMQYFPAYRPPADGPEGLAEVFSSAKAYGLNHLRFHSWCPPTAAFEVADSDGLLPAGGTAFLEQERREGRCHERTGWNPKLNASAANTATTRLSASGLWATSWKAISAGWKRSWPA